MRTHRTALRLAAVLLGCLLGAAPVSGGEADPAERARGFSDALPQPSTAHGFDITCYVLERGAPYGRLTLSARPEAVDGVPHWRVRDRITPLSPGRDRVELDALLDRRLRCLEGSYHRRNAQGFLKAAFRRMEAAYAFEFETQEYENRLDVASREPALTGLAGLLLWLRLAPLEPGVYELPELDPNPAGGDPFVMPARIEIHRRAGWRVRGETVQAWIVSFTRGKQAARIALDPKDRSFLGMTFLGLPFMFVPEGSGRVGLANPEEPGVAGRIERAIARTRAIRAALPVPTRGLDFRGDLRFGDTIVGETRLAAVPTAFEGRPAWRVTETRRRATGEAEVRYETTAFLGRDLSVLRGERLLDQPTAKTVSTYVRKGPHLETVHEIDGKRREPVASLAPDEATTGLVSVILFLRAVPAEPALYVLPGWDPRWARTPKAGSGSFATNLADVHIEVRGAGTFTVGDKSVPSLVARCSTRTGERYEVHLDPETRAFLGVVGEMPRLTIAAHGLPGKSVTWYDAIEGVPKTARQAFIKFGRGYHLPRADLLADAFHWPSMTADAIARGTYPAGTSEAHVKKEWVDVFVKMSKHRTKADCDDLLFQIFMTSRETTNADGSVSLTTLPAYGGHTYRMQRVGERWFIVKID